jgi:protein-tyrosine phosphatase
MKVLMVCLGNICRSPLAEGILKNKIAAYDLDWQVDSAGTGSWHIGELPDPRSVATARKYGIDITDQRARQFRASDLDHFDLILTMDQQNYRDVIRLAQAPEQEDKVHMIMNFVQPESNQSVPDPYWDDDGFEQVYRMLEEACDKIIVKFNNTVSSL